MCITNEKEFLSYDALSNRLVTLMMDPGLTQRFRAIISLSIRATWIPHFEKICSYSIKHSKIDTATAEIALSQYSKDDCEIQGDMGTHHAFTTAKATRPS